MKMGPVEILLVEDNPRDLELTLRALESRNVANGVHVVRDGAEALEFLFCTGSYSGRRPEQGPRLVLLDLNLPKIEGLDVLARIRGDSRTRSIPVVVLASSREGPDITRAYDLGVNSYVVKPVDFDQFARVVGDLGFYWALVNATPGG